MLKIFCIETSERGTHLRDDEFDIAIIIANSERFTHAYDRTKAISNKRLDLQVHRFIGFSKVFTTL